MAITSQPVNNKILPVHRPLVIELTQTGSDTEPIKQAVIEVACDDNIFTYRRGFDTEVFVGSVQTVTFKFDVSAIVKDCFCVDGKPESFGDFPGFYVNDDETLSKQVDIQINYEKEVDGLVVDAVLPEAIIQFYAVNASLDWCSEHDDLTAYCAPVDRCFLTNRPSCVTICRDDPDFLHFLTDGINAFRITTFNALGLKIDDDIILTGIVPTLTGLATFGSSVDSINNATFESGGLVIDNAVHSYTIEGGDWDLVTFTAVTKPQTFSIVNCCDERKCVFLFLNRLGGVDRVTLDGLIQKLDAPTSETFGKFLDLDVIDDDFGTQKMNSQDVRIVNIVTNVKQSQIEWLSELQTSTRVCKYVNGKFKSVVIEDVETVRFDPDSILYEVSITARFSVDQFIQNNV